MTDVDTTVMVPNPYKAALEAAAARARPEAAACATALDQVISAMNGKAWTGGTSDAFFSALTANDGTARDSGQDCVTALETAANGQPERVESTAWQIHWRNLMSRY